MEMWRCWNMIVPDSLQYAVLQAVSKLARSSEDQQNNVLFEPQARNEDKFLQCVEGQIRSISSRDLHLCVISPLLSLIKQISDIFEILLETSQNKDGSGMIHTLQAVITPGLTPRHSPFALFQYSVIGLILDPTYEKSTHGLTHGLTQ